MTDRLFTRAAKFADEAELITQLVDQAGLDQATRQKISQSAATLVHRIRTEDKPTMMEHFLSEYGLSSREGVALMCLAEAMLRVPDNETIDALIEDKIAPSDWGKHIGQASSPLVNASTWTLMLTGRVLDDTQPGIAGVLRGAIKRLGEPVIRAAVGRAMKEMGRQFVLGETIEAALKNAAKEEAKGYTYSYDMLGEAAMTTADAVRYAQSYSDAIDAIAGRCDPTIDIAANPGISIKLSALHPRYEVAQEDRVLRELPPVVLRLAQKAKAAGMGLNIDAEEQDRLVLSLKVIEKVLASPDLAGWDGFGIVIQAYGKRASDVIDWVYDLAQRLDRRLMVRLVKGAYWDTEMKLAQVEGLEDFTLFTSKSATDVSYIANAKKLLSMSDRIYPQFATHNAHSVASILELGRDKSFEFQRLHGMGERLHDVVLAEENARCRIYAPVGAHSDLLAYLVRRLLENGANSSFVNQIVDEDVSADDIAADPFIAIEDATTNLNLKKPADLFGARKNSKGFDLTNVETLADIDAARSVAIPDAGPLTVGPASGKRRDVISPATGQLVAKVTEADAATVQGALSDASVWKASVTDRANVLRRAAELYEENHGLIFATLAKEAGKTLLDAVGELREAVDFLRYYADQATETGEPLGAIAAISPWNFPLAIFTGQIAAALATGNAVIAKPAEQTPLIAAIAVRLMHEAGVPESALQLLPGGGATVGAALTSSPTVSGIVFTGSTETAQIINRSMARNLEPGAPLIAETGGLNAMIVDSTALPEQAVRDIVASAFQSAGQRCSALRCLYVQDDIAEDVITMIKGAMDELSVGDPWHLSTDVGPVIDGEAHTAIANYIDNSNHDILYQVKAPDGLFIPPTLIKVPGVQAMDREIFGPVLHIATFDGEDDIGHVINAINASGYGLTFGLHTRIDSRVQAINDQVHAGNVYVNRNQIGAVVGSQPFGGEGLSGTGPKAGGPLYLKRFQKLAAPSLDADSAKASVSNDFEAAIQSQTHGTVISQQELPGPTGEANTLYNVTRPPLLCLGPGKNAVAQQVAMIEALGGLAVGVSDEMSPKQLRTAQGISGAVYWGDAPREFAVALAERAGAILPLITGAPDLAHVVHERHLCIDTTAAGGNADLLAG